MKTGRPNLHDCWQLGVHGKWQAGELQFISSRLNTNVEWQFGFLWKWQAGLTVASWVALPAKALTAAAMD
jgi:hypothetical protein